MFLFLYFFLILQIKLVNNGRHYFYVRNETCIDEVKYVVKEKLCALWLHQII